VDATAGYNTMGTGLPAADNFNVGIIISWPIFNGFLTEHQVEKAKLRQKALGDALEDLRQRIYLEVKSAFLDQQTALQRIRQAELTLAASKAELDLANKRYTTGLGNIIELTDAERFFIQDDATYVDALYKFSVAKAAVGRATGQLLAQR
jgi:outer membrane protein